MRSAGYDTQYPGCPGLLHHLGIFPARKAVMHYTQQIGIPGVTIDDVFIGNGVVS